MLFYCYFFLWSRSCLWLNYVVCALKQRKTQAALQTRWSWRQTTRKRPGKRAVTGRKPKRVRSPSEGSVGGKPHWGFVIMWHLNHSSLLSSPASDNGWLVPAGAKSKSMPAHSRLVPSYFSLPITSRPCNLALLFRSWAVGASNKKARQEHGAKLPLIWVGALFLSFPGSPVDFLNPPEHVAVGAGEQACLRCDFRSACVPVACCWIFNRGKVSGSFRLAWSFERDEYIGGGGCGGVIHHDTAISLYNTDGVANWPWCVMMWRHHKSC